MSLQNVIIDTTVTGEVDSEEGVLDLKDTTKHFVPTLSPGRLLANGNEDHPNNHQPSKVHNT